MKIGEIWKPKQSTVDLINSLSDSYKNVFVDPEYGINRDKSKVKITGFIINGKVEFVTCDLMDTHGNTAIGRGSFIKYYERVYK